MILHAAGLSLRRPSCLMGGPFIWRYLTAPDGHRLWINKQGPLMREQTINSTCRRERRWMSKRGAEWLVWLCFPEKAKSPPVVETRIPCDATAPGTWSATALCVESSLLPSWRAFWQLGLKYKNQSSFPQSQDNHFLDIFTQRQWEVCKRTSNDVLSGSLLCC